MILLECFLFKIYIYAKNINFLINHFQYVNTCSEKDPNNNLNSYISSYSYFILSPVILQYSILLYPRSTKIASIRNFSSFIRSTKAPLGNYIEFFWHNYKIPVMLSVSNQCDITK